MQPSINLMILIIIVKEDIYTYHVAKFQKEQTKIVYNKAQVNANKS